MTDKQAVENILQVTGLTKNLNGAPLVTDVSLAVGKAQTLICYAPAPTAAVLLGCLSGAVLPDSGTITLNGAELTAATRPNYQSQIGLLSTADKLSNWRSVLTNCTAPARKKLHYSRAQAQEQAIQQLIYLGIEQHLFTRLGSLPPPLRLRVSAAKILTLQPKLIIINLITSQQAAELTAELLSIVRILQHYKHTILIVTDEASLAAEVGGDVLNVINSIK